MATRGPRIQAPWHLPWLFFLCSVTCVLCVSPSKVPRLGVREITMEKLKLQSLASSHQKFRTFYYNQTLDHFNYRPESYKTFQHRYVLSFKHWRGPNTMAPIFVYLGEESSLNDDLGYIGILSDNAARFGALQVYIEHRFYGESIPFVSREEALKDANLRGYFSSAQTLADYAEVILHIKRKYSADSSPVIVFGGSYGGMLAAWFRLKYPHVALGALASSAPVLYFDNITPSNGYYTVVTKDFKESNGLSILQKKFNTCKPLEAAAELKNFLDSLFSVAAQYDRPPRYPVDLVCKGIDSAPEGSDVLDRIFSGVAAYFGKKPCYNLDAFFSAETLDGWSWQTCSELVIPIGRGSNDTMFPADPFDLKEYIEECKRTFGVPPRPHWITTYYGGHHFKEVLRRFGSNIIFSNGLRDPYSSGGVLENISDSILAVYTTKGAHCMDLLPATIGDPEWVVLQRNIEIEIINGWILKYYQDLLENSI
ncbi:PROTEASE S28 PRO-X CARBOXYPEPTIDASE-RELATED [Salix viminalis]|uniref:PROTEASE S28 PRO-X CARBOXYPEPTIDASE-RELATED n=1 Tax=Salix viminalis TaxID=40686 RepID=A0A9Q0TYN6_SALVM|nr:PROTEASE S28 PRO-X CARBOXYPEPTIDASE-RELATED [Salix viminalis]